MYMILGASGNTGSIIANSLLLKGQKVRVMGATRGACERFVREGAEAFTADVSDAAALTKAFSGVRGILDVAAAEIPGGPGATERCDRESREGVRPALRGASEQLRRACRSGRRRANRGAAFFGAKTERHQRIERSAPARGYFMENHLAAIGMIQRMGMFAGPLLPDLKQPMIATRDIGDYAARRLLDLDFSDKQTRELLGERDLSMTEATAVIARGIGKPDLRYQQFPYDQVQQVLMQMGIPPKGAAWYIEMYKAVNAGVLAAQEPRSPENSTPTSLEEFVQNVFAPAYHGKAPTA